MSTSNQTYKELAIPYFKEVFDIIDRVLVEDRIPYYLVGASAIALELLKVGKHPGRGTKDIDFAIMVSSMEQYDQVLNHFVLEGFNKVKDPFTIFHAKYNTVIDLLPFGQVEENDTVSFNDRYSDLHVLGFREVLENPNHIHIEDKVAMVPPLPGMVILKLVAWSDRPEDRDNDLSDILRIISEYFDLEWDNIVESHNDLLDQLDEANGQLKIAAHVLGRMAKTYLLKSKALSDRILDLLQQQTANTESSQIARNWAREKEISLDEAIAVLEQLKVGLKE